MVAAALDLTGDRIIEEGSFWSLVVKHPGNLSESYLKGHIKRAYNGEKLAEFKFLPVAYDAVTSQSTITIYLSANDTKRLPVPPDHWVYDVLLFTPGAVQSPVRMLQGKVFVSEGVTDA